MEDACKGMHTASSSSINTISRISFNSKNTHRCRFRHRFLLCEVDVCRYWRVVGGQGGNEGERGGRVAQQPTEKSPLYFLRLLIPESCFQSHLGRCRVDDGVHRENIRKAEHFDHEKESEDRIGGWT